MSSVVQSDLIPSSLTETKSKKKRKPKKKAANGSNQINADASVTNMPETSNQITEDKDDRQEVSEDDFSQDESAVKDAHTLSASLPTATVGVALVNGSESHAENGGSSDSTKRFDALVRERDALRAEVTQFRESMEELQSKHQRELEEANIQLQDTQSEKEQAEEQYQNLLGKVNTIRSQLGDRLKADAEDLAQARTRIEELEDQKTSLQEQYTSKAAEHEEIMSQNTTQSKELSSLRNRANLSQQNWLKEKEELIESEAYVRDEFENAKQAMHDWEVLAMEERAIRKDLAEKVSDLEEQLANVKQAYEEANNERDSQSGTVDGLQRALQDIQDARKRELRELVENNQTEIDSLKEQLQQLEKRADGAEKELQIAKTELERALPFEKEVKEKNLLIGKLRHEGVILNDHLIKALRLLKKGKPEDNVDRQIVTNHLLHFLALDRSDPKKFQVLELIALLLGWTEEQREQAGLSRPGGSNVSTLGMRSLRLPMSPIHRTPSTPSLSSDLFIAPDSAVTSPGGGKESLAELWQNFLEREANTGGNSVKTGPGTKSRTGSTSTVASTPKP